MAVNMGYANHATSTPHDWQLSPPGNPAILLITTHY
jgi:hypothetical protein